MNHKFSEVYKELMYCLIVILFFTQVFDEYRIYDQYLAYCVWIHINHSTVISSVYGINPSSKVLDKILFVIGKCAMHLYLLKSVLSPSFWIGTMIDSFHSRSSSSLFQIAMISLCIVQIIVLPPALINSAGIWSIPGDVWHFSFSIASSRHLVQALVVLLCVFLPA